MKLAGLLLLGLAASGSKNNDSRKIKKQSLNKEQMKVVTQKLEESLIVASSMIANKDEILKDSKVKILEAKVKGKVDLGKKPWGLGCDAFDNITTITTLGDNCTMTAKTTNCKNVGGNCVCDVEITMDGNCDF